MNDLSIIIPTHARPRELVRCLESIRNCQLSNYEIILIADISDEETTKVADNFLQKSDYYVVRGGIQGPAQSRNLGLKLASGRHILLFDDDDTLCEHGFQVLMNAALSNSDSAVYGDIAILEEDRVNGILFDKPPNLISVTTFDFMSIYVKNFIYTQACIFPAHVLNSIQQDTHMRSFEDWEFLLAVASRIAFKPVSCVVANIYKDYVNKGNRRSTTEQAKNFELVLDYLYVYRRWPAPTDELRIMRAAMLDGAGLQVAKEFL